MYGSYSNIIVTNNMSNHTETTTSKTLEFNNPTNQSPIYGNQNMRYNQEI